MNFNHLDLFVQAFIDGMPVALGIFAQAFQMQPWPFLAIGALAIVGAFMPARRRRRRRAY